MRAMPAARTLRIELGSAMALAAALAPPARAQSARYSSEPAAMGPGGFVVNFCVLWTCDDDPRGTVSAPGRIDLVDASGILAGQLVATASNGRASVSVTGAGAASNLSASIHLYGADGTPADGLVSGTWTLPDLGPGPYTLRFWFSQNSVAKNPVSAISMDTLSAGGGGPVGGAPAPPPNVTVLAPASATVLQRVGIGAAASAPPGGNPLASVVIDVSMDNGNTWARVDSDPSPSNPADSESASYAFGAAGTATLRATATDTAGLVASAQATLAVGKASQGPVAITPSSAAIASGQSVAFTASGGATGNYVYGGAAAGPGPSQTVAFPAPGAYSVTVFDSGNANYNPSATASSSVLVRPPFFTLSVSASAGGSVSGGGSYPQDAQATAAATAGPGNAFAGWTGDATGPAPTVSVLMDSNKSLMAHFTALLPQTISFAAPRSVTTRTLPFPLVAAASSGLPVSFALDSGPATLALGVLAPSGTTGEVTVTATQPGNAVYLAAQPVVVSFPIGPPPPGVVLTDDSAATKRTDKVTRTTIFRCGPAD
jgi:Divergent InlB B-repeat domain